MDLFGSNELCGAPLGGQGCAEEWIVENGGSKSKWADGRAKNALFHLLLQKPRQGDLEPSCIVLWLLRYVLLKVI